jgi:two-component system response regulator NreC
MLPHPPLSTVLVCDDHWIVNQGVHSLLEAEGFQVLGGVDDGLQMLEAIERHRPGFAILDLVLPGLHGLEVIRLGRKRSRKTRFVVITQYLPEAYVARAFEYGACAYVLKQDARPDAIVQAVQAALAGRRFLSPPLTETLVAEYVRRLASGPADPFEELTDRERQVLQLIGEGLTNAQIGKRLWIGERTVETHRANLMRKLGFRSLAEVLRYAIRRFAPPDPPSSELRR